MSVDTEVYYNVEDLGKNLYRKKTYYTVCVEQDVLAKDKDEADQKFLDGGGINHSEISRNITEEKDGVETYMVDTNYQESGDTEFIGKVAYEDDEYAKEDGMVEIDTYAEEHEASPMKDFKEKVLEGETI
jgi:hypothetical protein|tara:strand:+ start:1432 stop:1821 length:390 start_codon:yes stop_codon:yes gene_type:complete